MKKITLLVLATLTLVAVSCGVNSLNPEKLELQKLPVLDATTTVYFNPAFDITAPVSSTPLSLYKAVIYTISTTAQTYQIPGYKPNLTAVTVPAINTTITGGASTGSRIAYIAKSTDKDSEIFDAPTFYLLGVDGKITIPTDTAELAGSKYKIWVIEVVR